MTALVLGCSNLTVNTILFICDIFVPLHATPHDALGALGPRAYRFVASARGAADVAIGIALEATFDATLHLLCPLPLHLPMTTGLSLGLQAGIVFIVSVNLTIIIVHRNHLLDLILRQLLL